MGFFGHAVFARDCAAEFSRCSGAKISARLRQRSTHETIPVRWEPYAPAGLVYKRPDLIGTKRGSVTRRIFLKSCSIGTVVLMAYAALGPAKFQLRPMIGWKTEHFLGFMIVTFIACGAWSRPIIVGVIMMAVACLLEALQMLTPDRVADLPTALSSAGGALLASFTVEAFRRLHG